MFQKKLSNYVSAVANEIASFVKAKLCEKKIVIISKNGIVNIPLSFGVQTTLCLFVMFIMLWISYSTDKIFSYDNIINEKEREIWSTNNANEDLQYKVADLHHNLIELNKYFDNIRTYDQLAQKRIFDSNASFKTAGGANVKEADVQGIISNIRSKVLQRIDSLETIIEVTGLKVEDIAKVNEELKEAISEKNTPSSVDFETDSKGLGQGGPQGGPFVPIEQSEFSNELEYLLQLEKTIHSFPISSPMERYWISSGFGRRSDPIHRRAAMHTGTDMVGRYKAKIYSSAPGIVKEAGIKSGYGNMVEIQHTSGITTLYGHLSKILVEQGQKIQRGDIIGLQGSSGRSTGDHLHYEVRYRGKPLDPTNFLKAGKYVF